MKKLTQKLIALWNKKLADSGFEDIENPDGSLKPDIDYRTKNYAKDDGRQEYYHAAREFLNTGKFSSIQEYSVWELHTEGSSYRTIGKKLALSFYKVRFIINKLQKLAGVKNE